VLKQKPWQGRAFGAAALVWALLGTAAAGATELSQVIQAALEKDTRMGVANAERAHAATKKDQAKALWRPQVFASAVVGAASQDNQMNGAQFTAPGFGTSSGVDFATSVAGGTMTRATLGLVQPLVNRGLDASQAQLMGAASMGETGWDMARQNTILSTAQQYWELALAQEKAKLLQLQESNLALQLQEADDRFKLGASPITDTHEARAMRAEVTAKVAAAVLDVKVRQQALADSTGIGNVSAAMPGLMLAPLPATNLEEALVRARQHNPGLRMQRQAIAMAEQELAKAQAASGPRLDLVAETTYERLNGSGDFGQANNKATRAMVGLQASWALYSGGMAEAKALEAAKALALEQARLAQQTQVVEQDLRRLWWSLDAERARQQALEQAAIASRARLDATLLGRQVGDRTQLDVLNAQTADVGVALLLAESRVAINLLPLRLKAMLDVLGLPL
jgi:outer membrane protein